MKNVLPILCILLLSQVILAGDLEPSAPPTGGTMKTLDQVEPRIPITSVPFTISTSGSYYLTKDLTSTGSGIIVSVDDVTIDFCGFSIVGPGTSNNYHGVHMSGRSNVEVRNGTVRAFGSGIYEATVNGRSHRIIDMRVFNNRASGIVLNGYNHLVRGCTVANNGGTFATGTSNGIYAGFRAVVTGNSVYSNGNSSPVAVFAIIASEGSTITDNSCCDNGISATTVSSESYVWGIRAGSNCVVSGNNVSCNGSSTGLSLRVYGIQADSGSTVIRNTACKNGSTTTGVCFGINVTGCVVDQNIANGNSGVSVTQFWASASCSIGTNYPSI